QGPPEVCLAAGISWIICFISHTVRVLMWISLFTPCSLLYICWVATETITVSLSTRTIPPSLAISQSIYNPLVPKFLQNGPGHTILITGGRFLPLRTRYRNSVDGWSIVTLTPIF